MHPGLRPGNHPLHSLCPTCGVLHFHDETERVARKSGERGSSLPLLWQQTSLAHQTPTPPQLTVSEEDTRTDVNVLLFVTADGRGEKGDCARQLLFTTRCHHNCFCQNSKSGVSQYSTWKGNRALVEMKNHSRSLLLKVWGRRSFAGLAWLLAPLAFFVKAK